MLKQMSTPIIAIYLKNIIDKNFDKNEIEYKSNDFYLKFTKWKNSFGYENYNCNLTIFGNEIKKYNGIIKKRKKDERKNDEAKDTNLLAHKGLEPLLALGRGGQNLLLLGSLDMRILLIGRHGLQTELVVSGLEAGNGSTAVLRFIAAHLGWAAHLFQFC